MSSIQFKFTKVLNYELSERVSEIHLDLRKQRISAPIHHDQICIFPISLMPGIHIHNPILPVPFLS